MKYLMIFCCIALTGSTVMAQNLLSNPNFSAYTHCPSGVGQIDSSISWHLGTSGSSDYFNSCAPASAYSHAPLNSTWGYQASFSNAYAGISSYQGVIANYKEYIRTTFSPLHVGTTYKVTIKVSLADSAGLGSDGLGVYFSTASAYLPIMTTLPVTPQVDYSSYGPIMDKVNWVILTKFFTADSTYSNLVIGNFKNDASTTLAASSYHGSSVGHYDSTSFYFIDSVSVEDAISAGTGTIADNNTVSLFPNPFTSFTTLSFIPVPGELYTLDIYNIQGRLVRTTSGITTSQINIERGSFESGFYYCRLYSATDVVAVKKFVIR